MKYIAYGLLGIGLMQMTGDLLNLPAVKAIGAATMISPAPKVFSAVEKDGAKFETYSTHFFLEWKDTGGKPHSLQLTPETYSRLRGPYNRRNVYGAALAYGPVLAADERTRPMLQAVVKYALSGDAPVLRELGVDPSEVLGSVRVRYEPLPGTDMGNLPRVLVAPSLGEFPLGDYPQPRALPRDGEAPNRFDNELPRR